MREVLVHSFTRKGGRESVKEHVRRLGGLSPQDAGKMAASMIVPGAKVITSRQQAKTARSPFKSTVSHLGAESLVKAAYSTDETASLPSGYKLAEKFTDPKTGLAVSVFVSPNQTPVVAFRGTEFGSADVRDLMTNVDPRGIGYGQFESSKQALSAIAQKYPGATVTGHSLGGALAQRYAAEFNNAGEVITFNSPGIDKGTSAKFSKGKTKVTHYVSDGDPVSLGGEKFIDGEAKIISYKSGKIPVIGNTYDKHMAAITGGLMGLKDTQVRTISANQLSDPNFKYGGMRATGFTDRRAIENRRKLAGVVSSPLNPIVGIAGQALGMIGIGTK